MAAKKTATKATAAPAPKKVSVNAEFLNTFTSELENFTTAANGYGWLKSAVIEGDDDGTLVTATYDGRDWTITF